MSSADPSFPSQQVLVVEDQPAFQRSIREAIEQLATPCQLHGFTCGRDALAWCRDPAARLDLALIDLGLPDIDGIQVIQAIRGRFRDIPIMVISALSTESRVFQAIRAGALGYLLKGDSGFTITHAIEEVMAGHYLISPKVARFLFNHVGSAPSAGAGDLPQLTPQETVLLELLAKGKTYQQAADAMNVALATVQSHIRALYRKLNVHSMGQAVGRAREFGLLP